MHFAKVPMRSPNRWLTNTSKMKGKTWEMRLENNNRKKIYKQNLNQTENKAQATTKTERNSESTVILDWATFRTLMEENHCLLKRFF